MNLNTNLLNRFIHANDSSKTFVPFRNANWQGMRSSDFRLFLQNLNLHYDKERPA